MHLFDADDELGDAQSDSSDEESVDYGRLAMGGFTITDVPKQSFEVRTLH